MNHVAAIAQRLSLRPPQRESLEILARVAEMFPLRKDRDTAAALEAIRREFPQVEDFERDFPSICFALATGVGKTRLMGAFIAWLYLARDIRHFFVLAPNLTIYEKLIRDFTPGTPKYVFQGIGEFAVNPPEIITGDNYENGRGVRERDLFGATYAHINIFNISKINSEVRGGRSPRIKRLSEYIGQSYFEYLSTLDDLVLVMDESHRYRGAAGLRALNELNPVIGLELTATPHVSNGTSVTPFRNVIYAYPLATAMEDGFVKEPAVATRENFNPDDYAKAQLEELKLRDGIVLHENVKAELRAYAGNRGVALVKPFMLVVAEDTTHANRLVELIQSEAFFDGHYRDKVITIHSKQSGEEEDANVERLLKVESADENTEIVVHVNKLKEGWDVTNLYTIVPLRAARVRTLVEQTIGRGLRLPYGKRTGVPALDTLTIVAHDEFEEIVAEANRPDSIIRRGVVIGRDVPAERKSVVVVRSLAEESIAGDIPLPGSGELAFTTPEEKAIALEAWRLIGEFEKRPSIRVLRSEEVRREIADRVCDAAVLPQRVLEGVVTTPEVDAIVARVAELAEAMTIAVPRIIVVPKGELRCGYRDFDLDLSGVRPQPVDESVLIQFLRTAERQRLVTAENLFTESRPEDYLVKALIDYDDVDYDRDAELLYKLAGRTVAHLRGYLTSDDGLHNVLQYHQKNLAETIHAQMQAHYWEDVEGGYEAKVSRGFLKLRDCNFTMDAGETVRDVNEAPEERLLIRGMLFGGFHRCLYSKQRFDSDPERRFALVCDRDESVEKWFKPAPGFFRIDYRPGAAYEPDFVVETRDAKYLCEPKRQSEMEDPEVLAKAEAATQWCRHATDHELAHGGKPWRYVLIPHEEIRGNATFDGIVRRFGRG